MKFVLAPRSSFKYLLSSLRKDDPFKDVTLVSKEELLRSIYPSVTDECLLYLVKEKGLSFDLASLYLKYIPYVTIDSKSNKLYELYLLHKELDEKGLLVKSKGSFANAECDVYYYSSDDLELKRAFETLNITPKFINFSEDKEYDLYSFERVEEEVYFILNRIASLIDSGVDINDIYIINRNSDYSYYLKKFAIKFGYTINISDDETLYSTGAVKHFLDYYDSEKDISKSLAHLKELMKDDELYLEVEDVVNNNTLDEASFELQKSYLISKFKNRRIGSKKYKNAVNVISSPLISEGKHYFVMGFAQGVYPSVSKGNQYLLDNDFKEINRLNNKQKSALDQIELINAFKSNNQFIFSFSKQSKSSFYYLSPISYLISLTNKDVKLDDVQYSKYVSNLIYSNLSDLAYFYKDIKDDYLRLSDVVNIDFNTYDNQYKDKAKVYDENSKISLSTSSLEKYFKCPFAYYLDKIIGLDEFEDTFYTLLGNIVHKLIEDSRKKDFDFDKEYEELIAKSDFSISELYRLKHRLKDRIQEAILSIRKREEGYVASTIYNEEKFEYDLTDKTTIYGRIDSLVTFDDKYYICIDYKTNSTRFDPKELEHGLSTQLPTYSLLVNSDERFKGYKVIGLYINSVVDSSIKNDNNPDKIIKDCYKLFGKNIDIIDEIKYIDPTIDSGATIFICSVKVTKDGSVKGAVDEATFEEYKNIVKDKYLEMDKELRNNNFLIYPYFVSSHNYGCHYCNYKDVCFVKDSQYHNLNEVEDEQD